MRIEKCAKITGAFDGRMPEDRDRVHEAGGLSGLYGKDNDRIHTDFNVNVAVNVEAYQRYVQPRVSLGNELQKIIAIALVAMERRPLQR